jgi:hypothetical protein
MTILLARGAGDPDRVAHAVRILRPSPIGEVLDAVAAYASPTGGTVYAERVGDLYRWSPATRGGPYPLARLLAHFLRCDHHDLTVGFVTIDGWCVVADPDEPRGNPYVIIEFSAYDAESVRATVGAALGALGTHRSA